MKTHQKPSHPLHALTGLLLTAVAALAAETDPSHVLNYRQPASNWESEALPIGNARMGAMLLGGVTKERIQFNEQSLWSGDNNWDGAYECGDHGFGSYRNFGDLVVEWSAGDPQLTSPSGHQDGDGKGIANTIDGNAGTKWCIDGPGKLVVWQMRLPAAQSLQSYSLTSAPELPERDPQSWTMEGSTDGKSWKVLDRRSPGKPFALRSHAESFEVARPSAYSYYRITFVPTEGASHFQISEVELTGVTLQASSPPGDYQRSLDIGTGIHTTSFTQNGSHFKREAFASHPDQVMVFHYTSDKPGALSGRIHLKSAQGAKTSATANGMIFDDVMPNQLKYACALRLLHQGGRTSAEGNKLVFENCDEVTLLLDARTNYKPDFNSDWRGADPLPRIKNEVIAAQGKSYESLREAHIKDLSALLDRVTLDVGTTDPAVLALPTDQRLKRYSEASIAIAKEQGDQHASGISKRERASMMDPDLEETLFYYGRYLLASCSRPGGLPANLQGLWNDSNNPAWASDYHNNINLQMNYWGAESTNLSECHEPLMDFIVAQAEACRIATRKAFGEKTRGWTARTSQSIFGGNGWDWNIPASAWYSQHAYEHYAFTHDLDYLRKTAYPILKEICEMWEDRLKKRPDGSLVVPDGWSPEHGPREDGVMHDQQLVWELFQNYLLAAKALNVDAAYQVKVADLLEHLAPNKIGRWGQLQEWQEDRDDPNDTHRHSSHLFAVYPGRQISMSQTPDLAKAAVVSLKARSNDHEESTGKPFTVETTIGDSRREWAFAWRCGLWARLGEGERAAIMLRGLLTYSVMPNLFCTHPPFQMDGNFGISGTMTEMLLQSHAGEISLLPAIPKEWAAKGSFSGLKARGNYTVSCTWLDGRVTDFHIQGKSGSKVKLRVNGETKEIVVE